MSEPKAKPARESIASVADRVLAAMARIPA